MTTDSTSLPTDAAGVSRPLGPTARRVLGVAGLMVLTFASYALILNGRFVYDDETHILREINGRSLEGLRVIWLETEGLRHYQPLTETSYWLEYQVWGRAPAGYHFDSVLLQALAAVLLWVILRRLRVRGAWIAAAIFAVHPVQAESVCWVGARAVVLGGLFYFATALVYLRYCGLTPHSDAPGEAAPESDAPPARLELRLPDDPTRLYLLTIALFLAALLSNPATATLPLALGLVLWWKRPGGVSARDLPPLLPLLGLGAIALGVTLGMAHHAQAAVIAGGAAGPAPEAWSTAIVTAGRAIVFYLGKLVLPGQLSFDYAGWSAGGSDWVQWAYPIAVAIVLVVLWLGRRAIGRGAFVAAAFFVITLAPMLCDHLPWGAGVVADRYQYLACVGPIALAVAVLASWFGTAAQRGWLVEEGPAALGGLVVAVLAIFSLLRAGVFRDNEKLWRDVWQKNDSSYLAAEQLGEVCRVAAELSNKPEDRASYLTAAVGWYRLADKLHPGDSAALLDEGLVVQEQGHPEQAMELFKQALTARPDNAVAHLALGTAYYAHGDKEGAENEFREAIKQAPNLEPAHAKLGALLNETSAGQPDRLQEASDQLAEARNLDPDDIQVLNELVNVSFKLGDSDLATSVMADIQRRDSANVPMRINFAAAAAASGWLDSAERILLAVLRDAPDSADAHQNLGLVEMKMGHFHLAVEHLEKAMELDKSRTSLARPLAEAMRHAATEPATTQGAVGK